VLSLIPDDAHPFRGLIRVDAARDAAVGPAGPVAVSGARPQPVSGRGSRACRVTLRGCFRCGRPCPPRCLVCTAPGMQRLLPWLGRPGRLAP